MLAKTISARKALTALTNRYNSYAAAGAWFRRCDHEAYKTNAVAATALLEIVTTLFKNDKDYKLTFVAENRNGIQFEWPKMEVL